MVFMYRYRSREDNPSLAPWWSLQSVTMVTIEGGNHTSIHPYQVAKWGNNWIPNLMFIITN